MRAHIRLPAGANSIPAPSPPSSPRPSPRLRYAGRSRSGRMQSVGFHLPSPSLIHRFACLLLSVLLRRHGIFLLAPLIYITGMLLYMGTISFDVPGVVRISQQQPGSVYRSPQVFKHLWPAMQKANSSYGVVAAWQHPKPGEYWKPCITRTRALKGLQESNGFIVIEANGGLNQQRSSICNAVALAGLLNATLVIPQFHLNSVWQDPSTFGDIYDEDHFINVLADDVRVVKQLPDYLMESINNNISNIFNFRVKAWAPARYYLQTVLPKLLETGSKRDRLFFFPSFW